jgi:hypothetical protein
VTQQHVSRAHRWKQRGRIYLWRYLENQRNYPDWHLSLDSAALASLGALFRFLNEDQTRCHRIFAISPPVAEILHVPNNRDGKARYTSPAKLRLSYDPGATEGWILAEGGDPLEWKLGPSGLRQVLQFLSDPQKYFDHNFGDDPSIWWWGTT